MPVTQISTNDPAIKLVQIMAYLLLWMREHTYCSLLCLASLVASNFMGLFNSLGSHQLHLGSTSFLGTSSDMVTPTLSLTMASETYGWCHGGFVHYFIHSIKSYVEAMSSHDENLAFTFVCSVTVSSLVHTKFSSAVILHGCISHSLHRIFLNFQQLTTGENPPTGRC